MFSSLARMRLIVGCLVATAAIAAISIMVQASLSTTVLFVAVGLSTTVFIRFFGAPPEQTVAEVLYQAEADRRR